MLVKASGTEFKSCPQEREACKGKKSLVTRYLLNMPEVFAIGLVWATTSPTPEEIMETLLLIKPEIDIKNVFNVSSKTPTPYRFRGMICFYGKHYATYFYSVARAQWLVYDDATVKPVGYDWNDVLHRCKLGHFHPSVLFYERVPGTYVPAKPEFKPVPASKPNLFPSPSTPSLVYPPPSSPLPAAVPPLIPSSALPSPVPVRSYIFIFYFYFILFFILFYFSYFLLDSKFIAIFLHIFFLNILFSTYLNMNNYHICTVRKLIF